VILYLYICEFPREQCAFVFLSPDFLLHHAEEMKYEIIYESRRLLGPKEAASKQ